MARILRDNELGMPISQEKMVWLTRSPEVAAYWADVGPRDWDEGRGGIIALDRDKLATRHSIYPYAYCRGATGEQDEMEEYLFAPIEDLSRYVAATFWLDELSPGEGVRPPRIPRGKHYMPATSLAHVMGRFRSLTRRGAKLSAEQFDADYWETAGLLDKWLCCE